MEDLGRAVCLSNSASLEGWLKETVWGYLSLDILQKKDSRISQSPASVFRQDHKYPQPHLGRAEVMPRVSPCTSMRLQEKVRFFSRKLCSHHGIRRWKDLQLQRE